MKYHTLIAAAFAAGKLVLNDTKGNPFKVTFG